MPVSPDAPPLPHARHRLAAGGLLAAMALMAFSAAVALMGALVVFPALLGIAAVRQRLRGLSAPMTGEGRPPGG